MNISTKITTADRARGPEGRSIRTVTDPPLMDFQHAVHALDELGLSKRLYIGKATMSSSYATGGDTVDAAPGDAGYDFAVIGAGQGYVLRFDQANQKVQAYRQTAATGALVEVPPATNLSAVSGDFMAVGP